MTNFEEYAREHSLALLRVAYLLTGSKPDAEDLTQESLLQIQKAWEKVSQAESPRAYGRRLLVNRFLTGRRKRHLRTVPLEEVHEQTTALNTDFPDAIANKDALRQALAGLPDRQKTALILRYYEQLSDAEIAEAMHIHQSSVRSAVARALSELRSHISMQEADR